MGSNRPSLVIADQPVVDCLLAILVVERGLAGKTPLIALSQAQVSHSFKMAHATPGSHGTAVPVCSAELLSTLARQRKRERATCGSCARRKLICSSADTGRDEADRLAMEQCHPSTHMA